MKITTIALAATATATIFSSTPTNAVLLLQLEQFAQDDCTGTKVTQVELGAAHGVCVTFPAPVYTAYDSHRDYPLLSSKLTCSIEADGQLVYYEHDNCTGSASSDLRGVGSRKEYCTKVTGSDTVKSKRYTCFSAAAAIKVTTYNASTNPSCTPASAAYTTFLAVDTCGYSSLGLSTPSGTPVQSKKIFKLDANTWKMITYSTLDCTGPMAGSLDYPAACSEFPGGLVQTVEAYSSAPPMLMLNKAMVFVMAATCLAMTTMVV